MKEWYIYMYVCACVYILYKLLYLLFFGQADCLFSSALKVIHLMLRTTIFVT